LERNFSGLTKAKLFPSEQHDNAKKEWVPCVLREKAVNEPLAPTQQVSLDKDEDRDPAKELVSAGLLSEFKLYQI
jgi:hypothetical protein